MNDPAPILDLIEAFRRSKTMFVAVKLGIFDGERPPGAGMDRLLDACVGLGLLEKHGAEYYNTAVADEYLRRSSPRTLAGYILYSNSALYPMWGNLEEAVIEGTNRWTQTFGGEGSLFTHFFKTEESKREFLTGMHGFGMLTSPKIVAAFDLSRFRRLVDLGGATGHLALAARERYPEMTAILFDLPQVIDFARERVGDRVELIAGDFFTDRLPVADLFAVGRILHDWSEDKIAKLLDRIYAALPPDGGLLIGERLLQEDRRGPVATQMQSLNMLVCTEGRERTLSEYTGLLKAAGFREVRGHVTGTPLDAILAIK
ncbi:MAG: class I SAM-dependent methyltransferase [Bryobacteraceae bacterium]|jgi:acetylserotonin N-methyltransferase